MKRFQERLSDFASLGASVAAISVDLPEVARTQAEDFKLAYPLLSDPDGATIRAYGVWHEDKKIALPAIVVVDREGIIRWRRVSTSVLDRPEEDEVLEVVRGLRRP